MTITFAEKYSCNIIKKSAFKFTTMITFDSIFDYKLVFDMLEEMVFIADEELRILSCNKSALNSAGSDLEKLIGRRISLLLIGDFWNSVNTELQSHGEIKYKDKVFVFPGGKQIVTDVRAVKLNYGSGCFIIFVIKDISDEKKEKLELLRFSNAIKYAVNPIQITDRNGSMVYVNPAFEISSGYTKEELLGKDPKILSNHKLSKEYWEGVWRKIKSGQVWTGQIENRRKDGTLIYSESIISPIKDEEGSIEGFLGVHNNATERKTIEQNLASIQRLGSISTLSAGIAHEIGNPLTSISSLTQIIQRKTHDEKIKAQLVLIKKQVNRIAHIIRQLVEFSLPAVSASKTANVNKVLMSAVNMVKLGKRIENIQFITDLSSVMPELNCSPDHVMQAVLNILMNAADSIGEADGTVKIKSEAVNGTVKILIEDSGTGITEENIDKIFAPFFTTKQPGEGIGLGLWVSYGIVRNLGGDILVESKTGKGSIFTILLPSC